MADERETTDATSERPPPWRAPLFGAAMRRAWQFDLSGFIDAAFLPIARV
jgi:hypothetical protein